LQYNITYLLIRSLVRACCNDPDYLYWRSRSVVNLQAKR